MKSHKAHKTGSLDVHTTQKLDEPTPTRVTWREIPRRAYVSYVMGCLVMLVAGTQYAFSAWSDDFKQQRGFSQSEVEIVGAMGNTGSYIGIIGGMLFDLYGTRIAMLFSASMVFLGFFPMYLTSAGFAPSLGKAGVQGFFYLISLLGCMTSYLVVLGCNAQIFPDNHRGLVLGSLLGFFALCAILYTGIYNGIFGHDLAGFQLMLSIVAPIVFFIGAFVLAPSGGATARTSRKAMKTKKKEDDSPQEYRALTDDDVVLNEESSRFQQALNVFVEKMTSFTFWLLFVQQFVAAGCQFLFTNNIGQLTKALNHDEQAPNSVFICVTLFGICSTLGRFATAVTDHVHVKRGWWMVGIGFGNAISYLIAILAYSEGSFTTVYITALILGLMWGSFNGLIAAIISEKWGTETFAQNFGWLFLFSVGASYAFNGLAGKFYDHESITHPGEEANDCVGAVCYRLTFVIAASLSLFAAFSGLLLAPKTCYPGQGKVNTIEATKRETRNRSSV